MNKSTEDFHRSINKFKMGYLATANLLKGQKNDMLGDLISILNRWMNDSCQLLNVGINPLKKKRILSNVKTQGVLRRKHSLSPFQKSII
jgi:hypothetical protein